MVDWRHEKNRRTARRLERVAPTPSVGTGAARMEPERHCGGTGSDARGSEPVDEDGARARRRGITRAHRSRTPAQTQPRPVGAASRAAEERGRDLWISRRRLDDGASGRTDPQAVWRAVSSSTYESAPQADQVQRPTADRARQPTR